MSASSFDLCVQALTRDRHRVWSLIVTIFGDLATRKGDQISTQTLAALTDPMGVKPEALRVALHRLRKDGWIESERQGRSSVYRLTKYGWKQTQAASPRIYGQTRPEGKSWMVFTASSGDEDSLRELEDLILSTDTVPLGQTSVLASAPDQPLPASLLAAPISIECLPDWLARQNCPEDIRGSYDALLHILQATDHALPPDPNPIERAVLRCLIVHSWRRVLLRHPDLPTVFFPPDCAYLPCRNLALDLLERLPRPALTEL